MSLIAITGGIGSGKSVISAMLRAMGYQVYDSDSRARLLMDGSAEIKRRLVSEIDAAVVDDVSGWINRPLLSSIVFSDPHKLGALNSIVHKAVRDDLAEWSAEHFAKGETKLFVECAILYESGLDRMVDAVWEVTAPREVRLNRVMSRGEGMTQEAAEARIVAQENYRPDHRHSYTHIIINDNLTPVIPQLLALLAKV